jgi:molybdopterin synthase catalytic subunit
MMKESEMDISGILNRIRTHPDYYRMGMIASHLGIVRGMSRDNRKIRGIEVVHDKKIIDNIIHDIKDLSGIIEVLVEINDGYLDVGDEIVFVAVGGDIRDNVFPALMKTVDRIKKEASRLTEIFED